MRIGEVIGTVTLNRHHPALEGARWCLAVPLSHENLRGDMAHRAEPIVVYDDRGAGPGCRIAISEGVEAAMPFHPDLKPIDAYNTAILDHCDVT
ncbi:MAG: carbon dioxide concentrating mechanism protein CcmL [Planctomycetia bacterium]|nr:carbon dioxide concentrating mechanism protein CcmL [Planctomycetia bacterium]